MKRLILTFVATVFVTTIGFANNNEPVKEKKLEKTEEISTVANFSKDEDVKTVTCSVTINGVTYVTTYSCFFCWGGSDAGCKAQLLEHIDLFF
jgi:hypothetical protein